MKQNQNLKDNLAKNEQEIIYNDKKDLFNSKLEEIKNVKIKELSESIQYIEQRARELKDISEEYARSFREEIRDIGKDGRSRTAISKLEKTIKDIRENKEEIENLINSNVENINKSIARLEASQKIEMESKIEKLDYKNTIQNLRDNITNIEQLVIEKHRENENIIEDLTHEVNFLVETKIKEFQENNDFNEIEADLTKLGTENKQTKAKIQNLEKELSKKLKIENYNNDILKYQIAINEIKENLLSIKNEKQEILTKNTIKLEKVQNYLETEIKQKIEQLNNLDVVKRVEKVEETIQQIKDTSDFVERNNNDMENQIQAILSIVRQIEEKYSNAESEIQSKDIEEILEKRIKKIEKKYEKLFEDKLKEFEKNIKVQEKIQSVPNEKTKKRGRPPKVKTEIN